MNARTQAIEIRDVSNLGAKRLIGALLLAFLLLNAMFSLAGAQPVHTFEGTQNDFTNECRAVGGTPKREATHVVSCTYPPPGNKQTCDFNQKPASCTSTPPPKPSAAPGGDIGTNDVDMTSGTLEQVDTGVVSPVDASTTEGVLVQESTSDVTPAAADGDGSVVQVEQTVAEVLPESTEPAAAEDAPAQEVPAAFETLTIIEEAGS